MSFNFKTKIIVKDINPNKLFHTYKQFMKDVKYQKFFKESENNECQYCKKISDKLDFGIPVYIKTKPSNFEASRIQMNEVGLSGNYCSFICSYKHFVDLEENTPYKKNIKFTDSGTFFKYLSYIFFKDYDIEKHSNQDINLNLYNIIFKKI